MKKIELTQREEKLLALLAEGSSSHAIAKRVDLSEGTVRVYLCHLYKKIGVPNRTAAAIWYVKRGAA